MEIKRLIIQGRVHELFSFDGKFWELAKQIDQYILKEWCCHNLNYWRKKGVIEGEEEKGSKD